VGACGGLARGYRMKSVRIHDLTYSPQVDEKPLHGYILYTRDDGREAAQHQVVGISRSMNNGIEAGTVLSIYQQGRVVEDKVTDQDVRLPKERVGELIVLVPQKKASLALITKSTAPVHIGDTVVGGNAAVAI